jgi:hypothetical protein
VLLPHHHAAARWRAAGRAPAQPVVVRISRHQCSGGRMPGGGWLGVRGRVCLGRSPAARTRAFMSAAAAAAANDEDDDDDRTAAELGCE